MLFDTGISYTLLCLASPSPCDTAHNLGGATGVPARRSPVIKEPGINNFGPPVVPSPYESYGIAHLKFRLFSNAERTEDQVEDVIIRCDASHLVQ